MVRWGQTPLTAEALSTAMGVFRPDIYDSAMGTVAPSADAAIGAFAGPAFAADDLQGHLEAFKIGRWRL
jgi:NitT/TauT family transport system ATP-binding protein